MSDGAVDRHPDQVEAGSTTYLTADQYKALQAQALRDWPESASFPDNIKRPIAPDWFIPPSSKPAGADKCRSACFSVCFLRIQRCRVRRFGIK